jgi:hypothetical protein
MLCGVKFSGGNEDQCTKYDPARKDGVACAGNNWYPDCQTVYNDCIALYIDTVLQTAVNCTSVPLWPVSPSVGWASGVDTASGLPNGDGPLVENNAGQTCKSRPNQGALDVHGPYGASLAPHSLFPGKSSPIIMQKPVALGSHS